MMRGRAVIRGLSCASLMAMLVLPATAAEDNKELLDKNSKARPSATLDVASDQMRLIMGGTAGKGVLHFNGKDYRFTFKSASAGLGAKMVRKMKASGNVYSLNRIEDFPGQYTSITQSAIAGTTAATAVYTNDKDVSIELRGTVEGAGLSLGGGIATVALVKE